MSKKKLGFLYPVLALLLAFSLAVLAVPAVPANAGVMPLPHEFSGDVTIGTEGTEEPAPEGTKIEATCVGVVSDDANPITTTAVGEYSGLRVKGFIDEGTEIEFSVDEVPAQVREHGTTGAWQDSYPWHPHGVTELDLLAPEILSDDATVTSETYTVSAVVADAGTITDVPFGTAKADFLAALTKGQADQTWNDAAIADPVVTGGTLVVTAQDTTTVVTYTVTVAPAPPSYDVLIDLNDNGWTLVSTDKYILSSSDNTSAFLGSVSLKYKYTDSGYVSATVAGLKPVEAIYVKTTGTDGQLGLNYSGAVPVPSSKDLVAGWNLISCATSNDAAAILSSLRYVQVGEQQGVGLTTLVSQGSYNLNTASLYLATLTDANWDTLAITSLDPFDGYWVYMNAAKSFGVIPQ